jgi:hypothetical protein
MDMKIKLSKLMLLLILAGCYKASAQGMETQFVPGIQLGTTKIKYDSGDKYRFGASLALMEYDHVGHRVYFNIGMTDGYYRLTTLNRRAKMARDSAHYAKNNGEVFGMRMGLVFGKSEVQRIGGSINGSYNAVNAIKSYDPTNSLFYGSFGAGVVYWRKIGKSINVLLKAGFEKMSSKKYTLEGRLIYVEATVGYELFQKFGVSVQPAIYNRKMDFTYSSVAYTGVKANQIALKIGISKFLR